MSAYETKEEDVETLRALAASMESMKDSSVISSNDKDDASTAKVEEKCSTMPTYPPLPEEPSGDKSLLCRVGIRLPDGRRVQRNFLKTDPIQVRTLFYLFLQLTYSLLDLKNTSYLPLLF